VKHLWLAVVSLVAASFALASMRALPPAQQQAAKGPSLPAGYRHWTHVKTMLLADPDHPLFNDFGGIHHVYVNDKGLATLKAGKGSYPDGSVFVFDLLEAPLENKAYVEGHRKAIAVIVKNAARYKDTGGWGWQLFAAGDPAKPAVKDAAAECFACHQSQKASDFVFSKWRP
jgi:hypothetical protein